MMIQNNTQAKIKELNYMYCQEQGHDTEPMSRICVDRDCQNKTLLCSMCEQEKHKGHETIPFKKFLMKFYDITTGKKSNDTQYFNPLNYAMKVQEQKTSFIGTIVQFKSQITQILQNLETKAHRYFNEMLQKILQFFQLQNPLQILTQKGLSQIKLKKYCQQMANQVRLKQKFSLTEKLSALLQRGESKQKILNNSLIKIKSEMNDMNTKIEKILDLSNLNFLEKIQFSWSEELKGKNIKITGAIAEQFGMETSGQRFIMLEPSLTQSGQSKITWGIKVIKFAGWIGVGICLRNIIVKANYFFHYSNLGHGSYMISNNGYCWSNSAIDFNSTNKSFTFQLGDTIYIEYDRVGKKLRFRKNIYAEKFELDVIDPPPGDNYYPCANICVSGDSIEIVNQGIDLS